MLLFLGVVAQVNDGAMSRHRVRAYEAMAQRELERSRRGAETFAPSDVAVQHRLGSSARRASVASPWRTRIATSAYALSRCVHRGAQATRADLEARALRGRHARVGRPERPPARERRVSALLDQFGRTIEYLRISVTDRCNFRCRYCMPLEGLPWLPKSDILSYEEIRRGRRQFAPMGLSASGITGGEPTIRPQLRRSCAFIRDVSASRTSRCRRMA
jgi:uncharacterized radical SAM superfamily Fe-S cluster-containing enzyme